MLKDESSEASNKDLVRIDHSSLVPEVPLLFDVYVQLGEKQVLLRRKNETFTAQRIAELRAHIDQPIFISYEDQKALIGSLRQALDNPNLGIEEKGMLLKQVALIYVQHLFTVSDIATTLSQSEDLVRCLIDFIASDAKAAGALFKLASHHLYTFQHSVNASIYAIAIARKVCGKDEKMVLAAGLGGLLHDIGKRVLPVEILDKTGKLNEAEWLAVRKHPQEGKAILSALDLVPKPVIEVVFQHHENFDGTGYPQGIGGDQISVLTRIVAIADVYDALTTKRSYQKVFSPEEALTLMRGISGRFDPKIFSSFATLRNTETPYRLAQDFDPCVAYLSAEPG